ncbi:FMN reductase/FAD reductase [NAD(P)H] [Scopulibacillus darangshiensis]|uniref:FMN reductase/FAD reductase [NAD(P)H] n=1 Tax=Scopulibacillus darangshiensis TaxID=442528 RepID=A0A4V2SLX3_9BACL|nr:NAD(P)H-dependent oxidoreductase [Scopulibacillus darangshiensis]TCP24956.1 FMN reductase/FAD reductase [NAD(P)H] [Scopulibacillus darangshiensis]
MKLLGISGTITGSKTEIVVQEVLKKVKQLHPEVTVEFLNLKNYDLQFCDGRDPAAYTGDTREVIDAISSADFYVIGTPIFQGSMTGALKNLFDLVPVSAMRNKVMGFVATGGTFQHYLVIENQLKPIAGFFRSYVAPSYVYVNDHHFNEKKELTDPDVNTRIAHLAEEVVFMHRALRMHQFAG